MPQNYYTSKANPGDAARNDNSHLPWQPPFLASPQYGQNNGRIILEAYRLEDAAEKIRSQYKTSFGQEMMKTPLEQLIMTAVNAMSPRT